MGLRILFWRILAVCAISISLCGFMGSKNNFPVVQAIVDIEEPNDEPSPPQEKRSSPRVAPAPPLPTVPEKQPGRWLAIFSSVPGWNNQSVHTRTDTRRIGQTVRTQCWEQGKNIMRAANGMGAWHLICVEGAGYQQQKWFKASDAQKVAQAIYDEDFFLIDLTYGDGEWLGLGVKRHSWQRQSVESRDSIEGVIAEIKKYWNNGYRVTHMAYGNNLWVVVFSSNISWRQRYELSDGAQGFRSAFKKLWDNGYQVTSIAYGNEKWILIGSDSQVSERQGWVSDPNWAEIANNIQARWNENRFLTHLIYFQD